MADPDEMMKSMKDEARKADREAFESVMKKAQAKKKPAPEKRVPLPTAVGPMTQQQIKSVLDDKNSSNFLAMQERPGGMVSLYKDGKGGFAAFQTRSDGSVVQLADVPESIMPDITGPRSLGPSAKAMSPAERLLLGKE